MPPPTGATFADVLGSCVAGSRYSTGQLATLSGVPKRTIAHWLEGVVARPRDWRDLVRVAAALRLDEADATRVLLAARHPGIAQLLGQAPDGEDRRLLAPWAEVVERRLGQSPFQAVADLPRFVGRQHEIQLIREAVLGPSPARLCSLHGIAGAGKTALAAHLAYTLRPCFPDGVLWARLDRADPLAVLSSFARAYGVGVGEYRDLDSRSRVVRELLADRRALIVLDNVETSDQAEPLLPPTGSCVTLITTRRQDLAVTRAARRVHLGAFERREESLDLFAGYLGEARTLEERESLEAVAALLGDLPLAVDIAASRMAHEPGWSASDFLSLLRRESDRLSELVYEDRSVRLSFGLSYDRLSPEEQGYFHALGAFAGEDFDLDAAAQVAALDRDLAARRLRSLYALSLVQSGHPDRYRLHPLLRDLALEGAPDGEPSARMVSFFVRFAEDHQDDVAALDAECSNLLAALEQAFRQGRSAELVRGAGAVASYLDVLGLHPQATLHLGRAIDAAAALGDRAAEADLRCRLGLVFIHAGQLGAAEEQLTAGLELTRRDESLRNAAVVIVGYLGLAAYYRSDIETMERCLRQALAQARDLDQRDAICQLLDGLSAVARRRGDLDSAEAFAREGLSLARRMRDPGLTCLLLAALATSITERGGDPAEVDACLAESRGIAGRLGRPRLLAETLLSAGYVLCERGDVEAAVACLEDALDVVRHTGFALPRVFVLCTLGLAELGRERYVEAAARLTEGLALARRLGIAVLVPRVQIAWGRLHLREKDLDAADDAFTEALAVARRAGDPVETAQALYGLARVSAARGDLVAAGNRGSESLAILERAGHHLRAEVSGWLARGAPAD